MTTTAAATAKATTTTTTTTTTTSSSPLLGTWMSGNCGSSAVSVAAAANVAIADATVSSNYCANRDDNHAADEFWKGI